MTTDLVDSRCRFMKKVNNHLQIQTKPLQILKVSKKKGFVHLHKFTVKVHHTSGSGLHCSTSSIHHFSRCLPVSIVVHPTQGDQPLAPHWSPKMSQHKWVRPQHWTCSLYGGSLQGVDWPTWLSGVMVQG